MGTLLLYIAGQCLAGTSLREASTRESGPLLAGLQAVGREVGALVQQDAAVAADQQPVSASVENPGQTIAPFGREDTAQELQSHAARTQDTLVDAVENRRFRKLNVQ